VTVEEQIERLTGIVGALASTVVHHDDQIGKLIQVAEEQKKRMDQLIREWQAYLRTIRPQ
jgi:nitrate reductase NapAB chaperone NapD